MESSERPATAESGLEPALRRRGRRLALLSHPAGMMHSNVYTDQLPTLALVGLGASEALVGAQRAFDPLSELLQLPTLSAVGRLRKRSILIAGQLLAVAGGLPLVAYAALAHGSGSRAVAIALASFAATSIGLAVSNTVWFPLLRGYVEPGRIGSFFGLLRTGWHLTLIAYFLAAQRWLAAHPGGFGPLFGVATAAGLARIALIARLPEAAAGAGERVSIRDGLALLRDEPRLRRYLAGMMLTGAARRAAVPFAIVMMRRAMGMSDAQVVLTTVGWFAGGFASLYAWGLAVDRFGTRPVFRTTALGAAGLLAALALRGAGGSVAFMVAFFFALSVLAAGFGVADTHLLFGIAPERAPTATLVVADVTTSLAYAAAPFAAGLALDAAIRFGALPVTAYRCLFAVAAVATALALVPLRRVGR
jgi:hypothetical protein